MNIHKNARLTPLGRERIVRSVPSGQTPEAAAKPLAGGVLAIRETLPGDRACVKHAVVEGRRQKPELARVHQPAA